MQFCANCARDIHRQSVRIWAGDATRDDVCPLQHCNFSIDTDPEQHRALECGDAAA
jgi:hypothetical protein